MFHFVLLLSLSCLLAPATAGSLEPKHFKMVEEVLMTECNSDGEPGVSWQEVQSCAKKFEKEMKEFEIPQPSIEEFHSVDTDADGTVTDDEWAAKCKFLIGLVEKEAIVDN